MSFTSLPPPQEQLPVCVSIPQLVTRNHARSLTPPQENVLSDQAPRSREFVSVKKCPCIKGIKDIKQARPITCFLQHCPVRLHTVRNAHLSLKLFYLWSGASKGEQDDWFSPQPQTGKASGGSAVTSGTAMIHSASYQYKSALSQKSKTPHPSKETSTYLIRGTPDLLVNLGHRKVQTNDLIVH